MFPSAFLECWKLSAGWQRDRKCDERIWNAAASGIPRDAAFKHESGGKVVAKAVPRPARSAALVTALQIFRRATRGTTIM